MKANKNIHVIQTDKPSRLYEDVDNDLQLGYDFTIRQGMLQNQNIYITSDKEIKEGDWILDLLRNEISKANSLSNEDFNLVLDNGSLSTINQCKKIILTTDQDLIKDGIQAIDDEFLEWFVKNPSCEEVETYSLGIQNSETGESCHYKYEIIIPKEEPKQRPEKYSERFDNKDNEIGNTDTWGKREKQETLEEAATIYAHKSFIWPLNKQGEKQSIPPGQVVPPGYAKHQKIAIKHFTAGYKLAQEKSYSEEEVLELLNKREDYINSEDNIFEYQSAKKWLEQFKKK